MSGSKEVILRAAYTDLVKAEQCGDFERALKTCNRILKTWQNATEAFRCKIVCLVQLSRFADALTLIKKAIPKHSQAVQFEKAYCEYRENRPDDALQTLEALGEKIDHRGMELLGQIYYRLERFEEARPIYQTLLKETADEFDELRSANLQAVSVQLPGGESVGGGDSYEQLYNEACGELGKGDWAAALKRLGAAEAACRETLTEEGWAEDEMEEELVVMRAQTAYAHHRQGNADKAARIYQEILNTKPSDVVVAAMVGTNLVALKGGEANLFDTRKKLKAASSAASESKLSPAQKAVVAFNNALLQLHSNQFEPCRKAIAELRNTFGAEEDAVVLETALLIRQKEASKAIDLLEKWRAEVGDDAFPDNLRFALAHLHLIEGKVEAGIGALESTHGGKWNPGPLSLTVALRLSTEDVRGALKTLRVGMEHWRKAAGDGEELTRLMEEAASLHLKIGETEAASKLLEELRRRKPEDPGVLASLIQAYAQFDPAKAEEVSGSLAGLGDGALLGGAELDVDALEEEGGLSLGSRYKRKDAKPTPGREAKEADEAKRKKRKRKIRLPANFDPAVPADPERWLPKYERSTFKRRKDRRKGDQGIGRGAQGAVSAAAADLDMSGKPGAGPASPKATGPSPIPAAAGPRQQRPGGQAKAKKKPKKGGAKW